MNTHDIELPPLPSKKAHEHYSSTMVVTVEDAEDAIRTAIEADRVQRHLKEKAQLEQEWAHLRAMRRQYEADRQRRGEPVAWMTEDGRVCSKETRDTAMPNVSRVLFNIPLYRTPQPAEPVKVPSDIQPLLDMIDTLCNGLEWNIENYPNVMGPSDDEALADARALLARYGRVHD